jgi:hypothetical protein
LPAQVPLHTPTALTITINREQQPGVSDQVKLGLKERKWPLKVIATLISVQPEDFLIQGASYGIIDVPEMADSAPLTFTLIPQSMGKKNINILFEQVGDRQPDYIVTTCLHTEVIPSLREASVGNAEVRHAPKFSGPSAPPDVTIYIKHTTGLHYNIYVRTAEDNRIVSFDSSISSSFHNLLMNISRLSLQTWTGKRVEGFLTKNLMQKSRKLVITCMTSFSMKKGSRGSTGNIWRRCPMTSQYRSFPMSRTFRGSCSVPSVSDLMDATYPATT